ncbi:hypothetical protein XENOCAPTIV_000912 [Xenoophorus captivus]|uniref:Uncharacterized protein n=1 Tax=Xenoophorus captivus TaxID=1517983 RepID=A0ABV0QGV8_9TELE
MQVALGSQLNSSVNHRAKQIRFQQKISQSEKEHRLNVCMTEKFWLSCQTSRPSALHSLNQNSNTLLHTRVGDDLRKTITVKECHIFEGTTTPQKHFLTCTFYYS